MTYYVQFTEKEALIILRERLNMNILFWRDVQNKGPTSYNSLLEMIRREIINKELNYHRSRANRGLPALQMQRMRGPTSHPIDHQARQSTLLNLGQKLVVATLNIVPILAYEEVNPNAEVYQRRTYQQLVSVERGRGRSARPRNRDEVPPYYTYHHSYSHNTIGC